MSPALRWLAPEVIQTSAMDCGPASLKCLLEGLGIPVSYGRLREACQTDVDGTSIDTLEDVAVQLGLDAVQVVVPADHALRVSAACLPALAVVLLPSGLTHFVVIWRRVGDWVQVMDPGAGRQWMRADALTRSLYRHTMTVPAEDWREWAGGDDFLVPLADRLGGLDLSPARRRALLAEVSADPGWRKLASLDATARLTDNLCEAGALRRGGESGRTLEALWARVQAGEEALLPTSAWTVVPVAGEEGEQDLAFTGAVLLQVKGRRQGEADPATGALPPDLAAALSEPPERPGRDLLRLLRQEGWRGPAGLLAALGLGAGAVMVEAAIFRALMELGRVLVPLEQRLLGMLAVLAFALGLMLLELGVGEGAAAIGRRLELRLRVALLTQLPRLPDRYFKSRLISDMAERAHAVHLLRALPTLAVDGLRSAAGLLFTVVGISWIDPWMAPVALLAAALALALPLSVHPLLTERELRQRSHGGALARMYLDALLGLVPLRTHRAERALRHEHGELLGEWVRAGRRLLETVVATEAAQAALGAVLAAGLVSWHLLGSSDPAGGLLLAWWALQVPVLGETLAQSLRQVPARRNITLRLMELLGVHLEGEAPAPRPVDAAAAPLGVRLEGVSVVAGGHSVLAGIDLDLAPGSHVGVVGPSGAGKSSLVGLLLGWHRPVEGRVLIDGEPLEGAALWALRRRTAWVDPEVQLMNRSLSRNLLYGNPARSAADLGQVLEGADLRGVLQDLPDGLGTSLGDGGGLLSGGQGQRVRLGRALARADVGLVILDEAFRGLDRAQRRALLARARAWWRHATLIAITHDVGDTLDFERVIVIEAGRVAEDGVPAALMERPEGRYRAMVEAEAEVRRQLWEGAGWRHLWLAAGRVEERP